MSLLIDALRKAEQAKRDAAPSPTTGGEHGRAADYGAANAEASTRPPLPPAAAETAEAYLATQARGPAAEPARAPQLAREAAPTTDADAAARNAVRLLFDAKAPPPRPLLRILAGAGAVAGLTIAAWVWWEVQPEGNRLSPGPAMTNLPPRTQSPTPTGFRPSDPALQPAAVRPMPKPSESPGRAASPSTAAAPPASLPPSPAKPAVETASPPSAVARSKAAATAREDVREPATPATPGLGTIQRGTPPEGPPPKLVAAYAAYGEGRLDDAGRLYREVLAELPLNGDAINGLGAVALREGRRDEAERWFRHALALAPQDPVAAAGLANLTSPRAPVDTESRLKHLLAAAPDAAPAQFALGNALALQQRWSEAQQAYFRAYALDGDNPDYLFNLAVSLDHLQQRALAERFYLRALEAAIRRPAAFDAAAARARLDALSKTLSPP